MRECDVLVVGGGPAGSSCARALLAAGADVLVVDRAAFPRDKVCAGWITPAVVDALQPFRAFRTGTLDGPRRETTFGEIVSYGIRRCEFDHYLLERSGAQVVERQPVRSIRRDGDAWIVDEQFRARMLVGAGGHFCPVARALNADQPQEEVIVAQEIEFRLDPEQAAGCRVAPECPDLFFWPDLRGYGWCVRKGDYLNVGVGRLAEGGFPAVVRRFADLVDRLGIVPGGVPSPWKGHAYLIHTASRRRVVDDGVVLVGDAAGLALAPSGEGILTAIESGLAAAEVVAAAGARRDREALGSYERWIDARIGPRGRPGIWVHLPGWVLNLGARAVLGSGWLTRRVLIEDGFLHTRRPPFTPWRPSPDAARP